MRRKKKGANIKLAFLLIYIQQNYTEKRTKSERSIWEKLIACATCSGEIATGANGARTLISGQQTHLLFFKWEKKKKKQRNSPGRAILSHIDKLYFGGSIYMISSTRLHCRVKSRWLVTQSGGNKDGMEGKCVTSSAWNRCQTSYARRKFGQRCFGVGARLWDSNSCRRMESGRGGFAKCRFACN